LKLQSPWVNLAQNFDGGIAIEAATPSAIDVTGIKFVLFALFMAAVLIWQLISGTAMSFRRFRRVTREGSPLVYWLSVAAQFVILLLFLFTGGKWYVR
jgi:hypothetical protein